MKRYLTILFAFISIISFGQRVDNATITGERHRIHSKFLDEERSFQIYLPPNYYFSDKSNFPVVYLIDGDYNFHFNTALIELLSSVASRIPEMIVVGISDKGNAQYRIDCTPTGASNMQGNATNFMAFIEQELKTHIQKNYKTSDYDLIIGHSLGGLFVTNYFLEQPKAFDSYIAIDPSLWWGDFEISERADSLFKTRQSLESKFYISLANTKGMGVRQFVGVLDKYYPEQQKWHFLYYPEESHGSVGLTTITDALKSIFSDWEISREKFYSFKTAKDVVGHYKKFATDFSTSFSIPSSSLSNIVYYYFRKDLSSDMKLLESEIKLHFPSSLDDFYTQLALNHFQKGDLDKAEEIYKKQIQNNPLSFKSQEGLSKVLYEKKAFLEAAKHSQKSLEIAEQLKVRQWLWNELVSNDDKIKAALKKK